MSQLFSPLTLRELTIRNRILVSPMCMYSAEDGVPNDWHLVHLGSRAVGGAGMVVVEATAVTPEGRISPHDTGLWNSQQVEAFTPITRFIRERGSIPAVQLAHAGRKASTDAPWRGGGPVGSETGGWQPIGPSPIPFDVDYPVPTETTLDDINRAITDFATAAGRALEAGFEVAEVHAAHGYLLHQFLSPLSNNRTDDFGGSLQNRMRLTLRVAEAVRSVWPAKWPVFVRISATDWIEGGWNLTQSIQLCRALKEVGVDLIDCSSGGNAPRASIPVGPGYQVPFSEAIRRETGIATGAVGMISEPRQAEQIIAEGQADVVLLARGLLHDPYWPLHAAETLGVAPQWPNQYARVKTRPPTIPSAAKLD